MIAIVLLNKSIKECFVRIVLIEEALGFFELRGIDGITPLLPESLRQSATRRWPQIDIWYVTNTVMVAVCLLVFSYFYFVVGPKS
jgi:hypothetical protein